MARIKGEIEMLLEVNHLSKKYKTNDFYSLDDVSFKLNKGEIVGLIGRNGFAGLYFDEGITGNID